MRTIGGRALASAPADVWERDGLRSASTSLQEPYKESELLLPKAERRGYSTAAAREEFVILTTREERSTVSVTEAAAALAMSPGALRLWESQGLISPPRDERGRRRYGAQEMDRLRRIKWWRVRDFNAPAIKRMLEEQDYAGISGDLGPDTPSASADPSYDGAYFRTLRHSAGLTLREVANRSGLSVSFLSAIERGLSRMSPSAETRLLLTLRGEDPIDDHPPTSMHSLGAGRQVTVAPGITYEWLTAGRGLLEPQYAVIAPGAGSADTYQHDGEEFLLVLGGEFRVWLGSEEHVLRAEDSLHFMSQTPHRWRNESSENVRALWVTTERGVWGPVSERGHRHKHSDDGSGGSVVDSTAFPSMANEDPDERKV